MRKLVKLMYWIPFVGMLVEFIDGVWHLDEIHIDLPKKYLAFFVTRVIWHLVTIMIILKWLDL